MAHSSRKKPDLAKFVIEIGPKRLLELTSRMVSDEVFAKLMAKSEGEYLNWDNFRHRHSKMPEGITVEEAWCCLIIKRNYRREILPIKSNGGENFGLGISGEQHRLISEINSKASGTIALPISLPQTKERKELLINGLMEEVITSSQIEGARTLKEVAKKMLLSKRRPRDESEKMILNNYIAMSKVNEWKERDLSEEMIKEIHQIITDGLLAEDEIGQYRQEKHDITVSNAITGKVYHRPKNVSQMKKEMKALCRFANTDDENNYFDPIVKAIILHFWMGYLHPFTDGNGRTARAIFYWYSIKKGFWLFEYISISSVIKKSKIKYQKAYSSSAQEDELDLGYFVQYILRAILQAIDNFEQYLKRKMEQEEKLREDLKKRGDFNHRQVSIIYTLNKYGSPLDIATHQIKFGLSYEMARKDFLGLERSGLLKKRKRGKKFVYSFNEGK